MASVLIDAWLLSSYYLELVFYTRWGCRVRSEIGLEARPTSRDSEASVGAVKQSGFS